MTGTTAMPAQTFELSSCPQYQFAIDLSEGRIRYRLAEGSVVVYPSPDRRVEHVRQIIQRLVTAQLQIPAPHFLTDRLRSLGTDCRTEVDEGLAVPIP